VTPVTVTPPVSSALYVTLDVRVLTVCAHSSNVTYYELSDVTTATISCGEIDVSSVHTATQ
jgi:hypothetical protein